MFSSNLCLKRGLNRIWKAFFFLSEANNFQNKIYIILCRNKCENPTEIYSLVEAQYVNIL